MLSDCIGSSVFFSIFNPKILTIIGQILILGMENKQSSLD